MTFAMFSRRLLLLGIVVAILITISLMEYLINNSSSNTFIGYHSTLFGLLIGAYAAYCFQQRAKFNEDVRKWWFDITLAKSEILKFLDTKDKKEESYLAAYYKLSNAMDNLRLIYKNVDFSDKNPKGLYPYEQVRDLVEIAALANPANKTAFNPSQIKEALFEVFSSLRHSIQDETRAIVPDFPFLNGYRGRKEYVDVIKEKCSIDLNVIRRKNSPEESFNSSCAGNIPPP